MKAIISTDLQICIKVKSLIINNNNENSEKNPFCVFEFQKIRNLSYTFNNTNKVYANLIAKLVEKTDLEIVNWRDSQVKNTIEAT